jgi:hypothetical protein
LQRDAEIVVRLGVLRFEADGLLQFSDGLVALPFILKDYTAAARQFRSRRWDHQ